MSDPNRNARWCRLIAEELVRAGIQHAVLCPGSRNNPLLFALAAQSDLICHSHIDERSAGFLALGMARASGRPAVVCVTSGSALANLLPAVTEAHAAGLPLIVISADRPWEAHACGAPQTMRQHGALAGFATEFALGEPTDDANALRSLRARVSRLAQTRTAPMHLNVPLRDPLPPLPDASWQPPALPDDVLHGRHDEDGCALPFTALHIPTTITDLPDLPWLRPGLKGVIVAGVAGQPLDHLAVAALAHATGWPVLADAASGARHPDVPTLVTTADALLAGPLAAWKPELVIQLGPAPLARPVYEWLAKQDCPWLICEGHADRDWLNHAWLAVQGDATPLLGELADRCGPGDAAWSDAWQQAERRARATLETTLADGPWDELTATNAVVNHPAFSLVHLASSMAIRHANLVMNSDADRQVFANRGLNGIDGTIGTFLGEAAVPVGLDGHNLLLIGDLAALHDLPALAFARNGGVAGTIVVLNNHGGAIFDYLPVAQVPEYDRWVRAHHESDFAGTALQFGLDYHRVTSLVELRTALDAAANDGYGITLIECVVESGVVVERHRALIRAMGQA
jgi:2-succinyl-5-enolpyruvyl-6-hydroxy-3-cyclohexene-1-carboxylate synthase